MYHPSRMNKRLTSKERVEHWRRRPKRFSLGNWWYLFPLIGIAVWFFGSLIYVWITGRPL